ncbi:hypothetical protein ACJ72_05239 [Emergomyces africanus]|uniref:Uncharacterized protein n=1 Tax=Emergomyces africanus TaxID=1955775 RepID=A0A1B7NUV8_9EURO|nr:hypothetical protein ACJ72_05239 [Emergomyces africanus]
MRPPPSSLIHKLNNKLISSSKTPPLRIHPRTLRAFPHSLTTSPILPTTRIRASFSTTLCSFLPNSSSRQPQATGNKQRSQQHDVKKKHDQEDTGKSGNPEFPTFSFEGLGLSRNMKMVVLGFVGVLGTIETWFWCQAIWTWWKGGAEEVQR